MNANLKAKLASYSIVGSAFLIHCKNTTAQIICNDIDPDIWASDHHPKYIDLNNDGVTDFAFQVNHTTLSTSNSYSGIISNSGYVSASGNYAFVGANSGRALKLNSGDTIGPNLSWLNGGPNMFQFKFYYTQSGNMSWQTDGQWINAPHKYLPVMIMAGNHNYYGWIRCTTTDSNVLHRITIEETAFSLTPDSTILAGQCDYALSTPNLPPTDQVKMNFFDNNLSLKISDPQLEQGELRVYNTEAQTILATDRTAMSNNFNLQMVPAGLYYAFYRKNDKVFVLKFAKQ